MATSTRNKPEEDQRNPVSRKERELTDFSKWQRELEGSKPLVNPAEEDQNESRARDTLAAKEANPPGWRTNVSGGENRENLNWRQKVNQRRRSIFIGVGAGGGLVSILAGVLFLLPFKVPSLMNAVTDIAGQRVERIVEHHAERLLLMYMLRGSNAAIANGNVIVTGNPIGDLFANLRTNKFEEKLKRNWGLEIVKGDDRTVRLVHNGKDLGEARNLEQIQRVLDSNNLTKRDIKQVVKLEIPAWQWHKRAKFALWLRLKYGIPRFGIKNSTARSSEDRVKEMHTNRMTEQNTRLVNNTIDAINCVLGEPGCKVTSTQNTPESLRETGQSSKIRETYQQLRDAVREATERSVRAAVSGTVGQVQKLLTETLIGKFATKAIPIVGWVDLLATLDHISWNFRENELAKNIPIFFKSQSYATRYAEWIGYGDQIETGDMDAAYVAVLSGQLNGAEESRAFNYMNGRSNTGTSMPNDRKINQNGSNAWQDWIELSDEISNIPPLSLGKYGSHYLLTAYYETIGGGGLLGWIGGNLGDWFGSLVSALTPDAFQEWIFNALSSVFEKLLSVLGWVADPDEIGAELFNSIHAGGTVSLETYCKEDFGCRKLNPEEANAQQVAIQKEKSQYMASLPFTQRLFAQDNPDSLIVKLAQQLPASEAPSNTLNNMATATLGLVGRLPLGLANLTSATASAATQEEATFEYVDLYGVDPYGATDADLAQPVPEVLTQADPECPESDGTFFNSCVSYRAVIESMNCYLVTCPDVTDTPGLLGGTQGGEVGAKVDYTDLHGQIRAGNLPDSMLCHMGDDYADRPGLKLLCGPALVSFQAMNEAYKQEFGRPMPVGGGYRTEAAQRAGGATFAEYDPNRCPPDHLWGTSIDFDTGIFVEGRPEHNWTVQNGPQYGWFWPNWAKEGRGGVGGFKEDWHFDYFYAGHNPNTEGDSLGYVEGC